MKCSCIPVETNSYISARPLDKVCENHFLRLITSGDCALTVWCESSSSCSQSNIELTFFFFILFHFHAVEAWKFPSLYCCKINLWSRKCDKAYGWMDGFLQPPLQYSLKPSWSFIQPDWPVSTFQSTKWAMKTPATSSLQFTSRHPGCHMLPTL